MNKCLTVAISALSTFVITAGGAVVAGMAGAGTAAEIPSDGVLLAALITGLMGAARDVQKNLSEPPK